MRSTLTVSLASILFGFLALGVIPVQAEEITTNQEITVQSGYSLKNDPYLFQWAFGQKPEVSPLENNPNVFTANVSAYTASVAECGKADGITASGAVVTEHKTLACPKGYAFGTKVYIEGMGVYECQDRGGAIKSNKFDIYMKYRSEAITFGRQHLKAVVVD